MTNEEKLAEAARLILQVLRDYPQAPITVLPGANLQSILADITPGARLLLPVGFEWRGDLDIPKPVTLLGGAIIGAVRVLAPDVSFRAGVRLEGRNNGHTIVTAGDKMLIEDCAVVGSAEGQHRGVSVNNTTGVIIRRTSITNIWHSMDAQCISGDYGVRDLLIEDCARLEASGENIIFGGSDSSSEAAIPTDIIIHRCNLLKPIAWYTLDACTCKNLFELKCAKNVLVEDCTMEYSFADGQIGFGVVLTVRNQDGGAPWSTIEDVTMRRITVRHVAGGVQILGSDYTHPSGTMKRVLLEDWSVEDISNEWGWNQRSIQLQNGGEDLILRRMKFSGPRMVNSAMTFEGTPWTRLTVEGCEFDEGEYGIHSPDFSLGLPTLEHYAPGYTWRDNGVRSRMAETGRSIPWPTGTTIVR